MTTDALVANNLRLVHHVLNRRCSVPKWVYDDAYSEGCIGLLKAAETFDESRGVRFATYACNGIWQRVMAFLRRTNGRLSSWACLSSGVDTRYLVGKENDDWQWTMAAWELVHAVLPSVRPKQRYVLLRHYGIGRYDATPLKVIAERLGVSRQAVDTRKRMGLDAMRKEIERRWAQR